MSDATIVTLIILAIFFALPLLADLMTFICTREANAAIYTYYVLRPIGRAILHSIFWCFDQTLGRIIFPEDFRLLSPPRHATVGDIPIARTMEWHEEFIPEDEVKEQWTEEELSLAERCHFPVADIHYTLQPGSPAPFLIGVRPDIREAIHAARRARGLPVIEQRVPDPSSMMPRERMHMKVKNLADGEGILIRTDCVLVRDDGACFVNPEANAIEDAPQGGIVIRKENREFTLDIRDYSGKWECSSTIPGGYLRIARIVAQ